MILAIDDDPYRYNAALASLVSSRYSAAEHANSRTVADLLEHSMVSSSGSPGPAWVFFVQQPPSSCDRASALAVTVTELSAVDVDPELKWIGWLWSVGALA